MTLLGRVTEPARAALLSLGTAVRMPAGRQIMRLGEPAGRAFLLLDGCVKVYGNDSGQEPLLAVRVGGDLVGEMGVLSEGARSATVVTCSSTLAREVTAGELRAFLSTQPEVTMAVASLLADRLRWANQRRVDFAATNASSRVGRVLVALMDLHGRSSPAGCVLGVSLTQAEVASLAGVALATAEKTLRGLSRNSMVRLGYRHIVITDPDRLRRFADAEDNDDLGRRNPCRYGIRTTGSNEHRSS